MAAATSVKRVGAGSAPAAKAKQEKAPKEKKVKPVFDISTAVDANGASLVNAEGKLTGSPVNFDHGKMEGLEREVFASKAAFALYRADALDSASVRLREKAARLRRDATTASRFKDDAVAKKAKKLQRMQEMYAKMRKELLAEGVELGDFAPESIEASN